MNSLSKIIEKLVDEVGARHGIRLQHETLTKRISGTCRPTKALLETAAFLRSRSSDLRAAEHELRKLCDDVEAVRPFVHLSDFGWSEGKAKFDEALRNDAFDGIANWLDGCFVATAFGRFSALDRLLTDVEMPPAGRALRDRARTARAGLSMRNRSLADPMLRAGIQGVEIGGSTVPDRAVRMRLALLQLRLAIESHAEEKVVKSLLNQVQQNEWPLTAAALSARWERLSGRPTDDILRSFTLDEASDMDMAVELIWQSRGDASPAYGLDLARKAVDAISIFLKTNEIIEGLLTDIPQEIWIAAAERAVREENWGAYDQSIEAATNGSGLSGYGWGAYYLAKAKAAQTFEEPAGEQIQALKQAGRHFLWDGYSQEGRIAFGEARKLQPEDTDTLFGFADALAMDAFDRPLSETKTEIGDVLVDILKAHESGKTTKALSWGYLAESALRQLLARADSSDSTRLLFLAFQASVRSVLFRPERWERWLDLADAASLLGLHRTALEFGRQAYSLDDRETVRWNLGRFLANAGDYEGVLEIQTSTDAQVDAELLAYTKLRLGDPSKAAELLSKSGINAEHPWAGRTFINALILIDRYDDALAQSDALREHWKERQEETDGRLIKAYHHFVNGNFELALALASERVGHDVSRETFCAVCELLSDRRESAMARLRRTLSWAADIRELREWQAVERPILLEVAEHHSISPPPLDEIDELFDARIAVVAQTMNPERELEDAISKADVQSGELKNCVALGQMLLALLSGGQAAARSCLAAAKGDVSKRDWDLAIQLLEDWGAEPDEAPQPAEEPDHEDWSEQGGGDTVLPIELRLPASWFRDHPEPVYSHPIFLRCLPEARVRNDSIPSVRVTADDFLEPSSYEILIEGECVEAGEVDETQAYFDSESLELLDLDAKNATAVDTETVAFSGVKQLSPLANLLERPAVEVIVRRLEKIVELRQNQTVEAVAEST